MSNREVFNNMETAMEMASGNGNRVLGGLLILSAVYTEFQLGDLISAEADKVNYAVEFAQANADTNFITELATLDDSVANVLDKVCCIEKQVNRKIEQGRELKENS